MNIVEIESHVNRCGGCYIRPGIWLLRRREHGVETLMRRSPLPYSDRPYTATRGIDPRPEPRHPACRAEGGRLRCDPRRKSEVARAVTAGPSYRSCSILCGLVMPLSSCAREEGAA